MKALPGRRFQVRALCGRLQPEEASLDVVAQSIDALLDTLPVGVWIADRDGQLLKGNLEVQRIWGGVRYVGVPRYGEYKGWNVETGERLRAEEWGSPAP